MKYKKAIYKITNKLNGKIYIGQSKNPYRRWQAHKSKAATGYHNGEQCMYEDMRTYGIENFEIEIIGWFEDYDDKEQFYIDYFNSKVPNGYNILDGGEQQPHKFGEEHHNSVYSQTIIDSIIEDLLSKNYTQAQISQKYGVNQQLITSINRGASHRKSDIDYPIIKTSKFHCDDDTLEKIIYLLKNSKCTCSEIGAYFGFDTSAIKAINSGRNHYNKDIKYPIRNFRGTSGFQSVEAILAKRSTEAIDTSSEM